MYPVGPEETTLAKILHPDSDSSAAQERLLLLLTLKLQSGCSEATVRLVSVVNQRSGAIAGPEGLKHAADGSAAPGW